MTRAVFAVGFLPLGSGIGYVVGGRLLTAVRFDDASPVYANGPSDDLGPIPRSLISIGHGLTSMSTAFAVQFVTLVVLAFVASAFLQRLRAKPMNSTRIGWILGLLLTLAVPFTVTGTVPFGIDFPMWIVQFGVLAAIFHHLLRGFEPPPPATHGERAEALAQVRLRAAGTDKAAGSDHKAVASREFDQATYGQRNLELGGGDGVQSNARLAARTAAIMSIVPVAYLMWTTVTAANWHSWGSASLGVILSVITEAARWLVTGFVFGLTYNRLPTRTGPTKALLYAAIWAAGAWAAVLMSRLAGADIANEMLYPSVQFGAFVFVLGLLVDMQAIRRAGGTWRDLREVYALHDIFDVAAAGLPAALLAIALVQQINTGAGADVAEAIISGVTDMSSAIKPKGP